MTTIIADFIEDEVCVVSDTRLSGDHDYSDGYHKIVYSANPDLAFAVSGDYRVVLALQDYDPDIDVLASPIDFVNDVNNFLLDKEVDVEYEAFYLYDGAVFFIDNEGTTYEVGNFYAIGSGAAYALGYYCLADHTLENMHRAIYVASCFDRETSPSTFDVIQEVN